MKERIEKIMRTPVVAHILAANERYNKRLGPQFAAAVTYFSVLSMVPILLFAIAMTGLTLTVLRPDLLPVVQDLMTEQLGDDDAAESIKGFINETFNQWRTYLGVSLLTAAYSGSNWVGNLKRAFRAMWRDKFADASIKRNFFLEILENLLIFIGLLLSVAVAFGVTNAGGAFSESVIGWLGLEHVPGIGILLRVGTIVLVLLASWLLFAFLFLVFPGEGAPLKVWLAGTLIGAVAVTAIQQLAGLLIAVFSGNQGAGVFGPVIIIMLLFNVLATVILMVAAWVGTSNTWEAALARKEAEKAAGVESTDDTGIDEAEEQAEEQAEAEAPAAALPQTPKSWADKRRQERWAARKPLDDLRAVNYDPEAPPEPAVAPDVPQDVAARSVKVGMGVGWGVGAATGVGIGAVIAALVGRLTGR
ncbi:hypothetical protein FOJ82_11855 [Tessaracoccus rhinocerotis]|uniref:YihY/virulence factor BrkB family protein n=1 Tax=Tessaracoccus rhinocerotis TaxID=1689449 RepID=A0A553JXR7_9ACTN|nr:YhjD/YihY/BrkB family envelope integrity protein [Tessaracoccus rhinocerotis]TRY17248.1 hypothetical protein FOJ82_11855 [Tessaracoccus rhinocerotis]